MIAKYYGIEMDQKQKNLDFVGAHTIIDQSTRMVLEFRTGLPIWRVIEQHIAGEIDYNFYVKPVKQGQSRAL